MCPQISKRMKKLMYLYVESDKYLKNKVQILRKNVPYLKNAERESLIELAILMKDRSYGEGGVVKQQYSKTDELLLVDRGQIDMFLPTGGYDLLFE